MSQTSQDNNLAQESQRLQAEALETSEQLKPLPRYMRTQEQAQSVRKTGFLFTVVLPGALIAGVLWFLLSGQATKASYAPGSATLPVKAVSVVTATPEIMRVGGSLFGAPAALGVAPVTLAPQVVRCYARENVRSVFSDTVVLENGLFLAEQYTRVLGGMIYNRRSGWFDAGKFGCADGLEVLEVEFKVLPTATKPATRVPAKVNTAVPTPAPLPTPTPGSGIVQFSAVGCKVTWLVWNVKAVYLSYGDKKEGVPGDDNGKPVTRDLCPFAGIVTLDAVDLVAGTFRRQVEVKP